MSNIYTEQGIDDLANQLQAHIKPGANIYLSGDLGSGKTAFTKKLIPKLIGRKTRVTSPTFQIVNEYMVDDKHKIIHIDLYRLTTPDDLIPLGILDALHNKNHICIVEWSERGEHILPPPHYHLHFTHRTPKTRTITVHHE